MRKILFILMAFFPLLSLGQEPLHYWGKKDSFLVAQADETFRLVHQMLKEEPPSTQLGTIRKSALLHMDWVLHDTRLDNSPAIFQFMEERIGLIVADLKKPIARGMKIYKLYNHAFIIKTKSSTVAFDLYRGAQKGKQSLISNSLMEEVVKQCDVMFVSHEHPDHADWEIAQMFINQQKTIVVPTGLWTDKSEYIKHMRSEKILKDEITLKNGTKLNVKVMPGYQDNVFNNVYIITTAEGMSVAHTGDQWDKKNDGWIDEVKNHAKVDVLLLHCWAMPLERMVNGFNPKLVITGHENELIHSVDHREPYWLNYRRMQQVKHPKVYMTWGENFTYKK